MSAPLAEGMVLESLTDSGRRIRLKSAYPHPAAINPAWSCETVTHEVSPHRVGSTIVILQATLTKKWRIVPGRPS